MTRAELDRAIRLTGSDPDSKTMRACRRVVETGVPIYFAARTEDVSHAGVYRKLIELKAALALPVCQTCGQTTDGRT